MNPLASPEEQAEYLLRSNRDLQLGISCGHLSCASCIMIERRCGTLYSQDEVNSRGEYLLSFIIRLKMKRVLNEL